MLKCVKFFIGRFIIDNCLFGSFFKKSIDGIVKYIDEILQVLEVKGVKIIFMVGGFFECLYVQDLIKKYFG